MNKTFLFLVLGTMLSLGSFAASSGLGNVSQNLSVSLKGPQSAKLFNALKKDAICDDVPNGNGTSYRLCKATIAWTADDNNPFAQDSSSVNLTCSQINSKAPECSIETSIKK